MTIKLNNSTFALFAAQHYTNPSCESIEDFYQDIERFSHLKRLLLKIHNNKLCNRRLVLNHIITLHNIFGASALPLLFLKIPKECWYILKTFLVFLNYLPDNYRIDPDTLESDIPLSVDIMTHLRQL